MKMEWYAYITWLSLENLWILSLIILPAVPEAATSEAERAHCLLISDFFLCVHTHSNSHAHTVCICEC